jgi:hypothetical protein
MTNKREIKSLENHKFTTNRDGDVALRTTVDTDIEATRLMMSYMSKMLDRLEEIEQQLRIITGDEL